MYMIVLMKDNALYVHVSKSMGIPKRMLIITKILVTMSLDLGSLNLDQWRCRGIGCIGPSLTAALVLVSSLLPPYGAW